MSLNEDLVNVVQILCGEIAEGKILASINVDFEDDVLIEKVFLFDHVLQGPKIEILLLGNLADTHILVFIVVLVGTACRLMLISAVKLIVRHNVA